jgi:hypothetical protein
MGRKVIEDWWDCLLSGEERKIVMLLGPARPSDSSSWEVEIKIKVAEFYLLNNVEANKLGI